MKSSSKLYRKSLRASSIVAMLIIISVMVPMVAEVAEAEINTTGTYFWVDPKDNKVEPYCTIFPVNIMIESADETWAWEATLNFNQTVLGVMSVTEGPWLSESDAKDTTFFTTSWVEANETGTISIGCTLLGEGTLGTSGSGVLCTILFHVEYCGRSPLDLQDTALLDMDLVRTDYPNNDGFFCATCAWECFDDIAIVDVRVNVGAVVDQGTVIEVNVTIHNEGYHPNEAFWVNATAETVTHDPLDADVVLVGDEILIGGQLSPYIEYCNYISFYFVWDTALVPGEVYTICAEVIKPEDDDQHDNVFIGPVVRVRCPHDIEVTDVKVLTSWLHVGGNALVNITVTNEGANTESFTVNVYADTDFVTTVDVANLAVDTSKTVTATWVVDTPGVYVIKANATVPLEKDTADNEKVDGTVTVIIDDVACINATVYPPCGFRIDITIKNNGTDWARFTVYVWADPTPEDFNPAGLPPSSDAVLIGVVPFAGLNAGENFTFVGLSPFGGIPYSEQPTLFPPNTPLNACVQYGIFAVISKISGDLIDDNLNNQWFYAGLVKARYPGDIDGDGTVGSKDYGKFGAAYGSRPGQLTWNQQADIDADGEIGSKDYGKFGANYGNRC